MVMGKALEPVVDLSQFPNAVVDIFVELPQTDAGTRCAAICAASMALAHAGISMRDMVSGIAVAKVDEKRVEIVFVFGERVGRRVLHLVPQHLAVLFLFFRGGDEVFAGFLRAASGDGGRNADRERQKARDEA